MRVALSGTPGTGKTAVADALATQGYTVVHLHRLAKENSCISGLDEMRASELIDVKKLNAVIKKKYRTDDLVFFDGHFGHLLRSMEKVIILRCHPQELTHRLSKKKWKDKKIKENVEAETIDVILCQAVDRFPAEDIFEIDTTKKTSDAVAQDIVGIVKKKFRPIRQYRIGQIDWSEEILKTE